jgi:hypothetical protein
MLRCLEPIGLAPDHHGRGILPTIALTGAGALQIGPIGLGQ